MSSVNYIEVLLKSKKIKKRLYLLISNKNIYIVVLINKY